MITSRSNPIVKEISKLKNKRNRDNSDAFVLEGEKFVRDALKASAPRYLLASPGMLPQFPNAAIVHEDIIRYLSELKSPQGVVAVFEKPAPVRLDLESFKRVLYLCGVQDAENVGALVRSAECAGFDAVIADSDCADFFSQKAVRASAATILSMPCNREGLDALREMASAGWRVIGADIRGGEGMQAVEPPFAIVIGNEGSGLSQEVSGLCSDLVRLPIKGECDSLNAAVAGGIIMYKACGL